MFNLSFIFDDANKTIANSASRIPIMPLPAALYMMQVDVINHYNYALDHYFTLTLNESFLQNSSLGPPYQKWAKFTNDNFELLSVMIHNLLRYTSRFIHETGIVGCLGPQRFSQVKSKSNEYTGPLCDINFRSKPIGIKVLDDNHLLITKIGREPLPGNAIMRSVKGGPAEFVVVTKNEAGVESEYPIDEKEFDRYLASVHSERVPIGDRSILNTLRDQGRDEIADLVEKNRLFGEICNDFYQSRNVAERYRNLNESYWI